MAVKKTENITVVIPAIDIRRATITVVGDSPLIMHAWSDKAKRMILDKQMKKAKSKGHDVKNPVEDFINSMYWLEGKPTEYTKEAFDAAIQNGARFGFKANAFKAAAVAAAYRSGVFKNMVTPNGAFHIDGEMVEIKGIPHPDESMVRISNGVTDIRYRGQFDEWSSTFEVKFNAGVLSLEQVVSMFNMGGFACGIGEYRPERGGTFGMFHVE